MLQTHPFTAMNIATGIGDILFTPCPGTKEVDLRTSLAQLAAGGARAILTLMPSEEIQRNAVSDIPEICRQLDLQWFHFSIEDDHAPEQDFFSAWQNASAKVHALLNSGNSIAIHCKGGTGRTGLVSAQILLERGMPLNEVIQRVQSIRPKALQIPEHLAYIQKIAAQLGANNTQ